MKLRILAFALMALAVAGCAEKQPFADEATVAAARYRSDAPPSITLYTMVNNRTGKGGHSSLLINASESVIFDPAGSFYADIVPERNDVLFGISPRVEKAYRSAHARTTFHVVRQTVPVTAAQAETAYRLALANGAVPGAGKDGWLGAVGAGASQFFPCIGGGETSGGDASCSRSATSSVNFTS